MLLATQSQLAYCPGAVIWPTTTDGSSRSTQRAACPLSQVRAGASVRIKQLLASPENCQRLREMGLGEEQPIKLLLRQGNLVCQVCNVRLGLSSTLAESIVVEPLLPTAHSE